MCTRVKSAKFSCACHKGMWGSGGIGPHILGSAVVGAERSASHPACFTTGDIAPINHWIGGC
jgi:hypothetical protein